MADLSTNTKKKLVVSAPGKVILFGEHSVVYGKLAIAASLGLRTEVTIQEINETDAFYVHLDNYNYKQKFSLEKEIKQLLQNHPDSINHESRVDLIQKFIKKGNYTNDLQISQALVALFYLLSTIGCELIPIRIEIKSNLTIGAGTGSSASFSVASAAALIEYKRLSKVSIDANLKFDENTKELINTYAFQAEKILHGNPSGIDNTICTFGAFVSFRKNEKSIFLSIPCTDYRLILIDTHISRDTKVQVAKVKHLRDDLPEIIDSVVDTIDKIAVEALESLKKSDFNRLSELARINHCLLNSMGVGHSKLDEALKIIAKYRLVGKLTGAGGGGYAFSLMPSDYKGCVEDVQNELKAAGFSSVVVPLGGEGVKIDSFWVGEKKFGYV